MRWLILLLVAFAGMGLPIPSATFAKPTNTVEIESISHAVGSETKESITFKLSGPAVPKVYAMKESNPRLVIDIPGSLYSGKSVIPLPEGKLATTIRTGLHQVPEQKTRVVIDLAKDFPVQYTREYSDTDNTLRVELTGQPPKVAESASQPQSPNVLPNAEIPVANPRDEKPIPPDVPAKKPKEKPVAQDVSTAAVSPQLLEISFDNSSSKDEMVLFHLNDFHPPAISAVEKDNPRVVCDFMAVELGKGVQENILANGKYVERIHTTKHNDPDKVQVVIELSPDRDYDLQQVFFKSDNLFVLIVNEVPPEKASE